MARCQHCDKLTHSEDVNVYFAPEDYEKICELNSLENFVPGYEYLKAIKDEYGKMKCGDIWMHFIQKETK